MTILCSNDVYMSLGAGNEIKLYFVNFVAVFLFFISIYTFFKLFSVLVFGCYGIYNIMIEPRSRCVCGGGGGGCPRSRI